MTKQRFAPDSVDAWRNRARTVMPGGVSSPVRSLGAVGDYPLFLERGKGSRVVDVEGTSLIDYIGSWGAGIAGHAHPAVLEAVERAARDGLGFGATTRLEVELAETVVERVPGVEQVRFVCSGTEAVMSAIRLARAATRRDVIVKFAGGYHGHADVVLGSAGSGLATLGIDGPAGVSRSAVEHTRTLPYNDLDAVHELFAREGAAVAAVIVEPVAGNMGVVPATPAFLAALRALTWHHGALLLFDEVMSGFRVARGGAQQLYGIRADIITLGKIVGGGMPVAAYGGSASMMKLVAPLGPVYQAGTLAGNPVGMAAGLATLRLLDDRAYTRLESSGARLEAGLADAFTRSKVPAQVQRVGSMLTVFFGTTSAVLNFEDARSARHEEFARFFRSMRRRGVLLPPGGYEAWFLSLAHGDSDIDATIDAASGATSPAENSPSSHHRPASVSTLRSPMRRVHDDIFELLPSAGNPTPLVRINRLNPAPGFTLYAKLEWMNPFGSVKDRAAWAMLRDLESRGVLGPSAPQRGMVEPTSGNTGISLAALASARGYSLRAIVPNKVPFEKKVLLKLAGAELEVINDELCPMPGLGDGSINLAKSHARAQPDRYAMPNQYANRANVAAHVATTGPEIWHQTAGSVTHVFVTLGTCGTATGLAQSLKALNPAVRIIAVQPTEGHDVPGLRNVAQLDATELFDASLIDEIIEVDFTLAYSTAMDLARHEGLLAGPSCGLVFEGARRVIARTPAGVGVMIFPDNAFKYVSNFAKHLPELTAGTTP